MEGEEYMKICIDPGHGGKEHGAIGTYLDEKDINLTLSLLFGEALEKNGVSVIYTRKKDQYIDLQKRCNIANKNRCDYFISFHCNNGSNTAESGSEIYCYSFGDDSEKLARHLLKVLININNNSNKGVKEGNFYILKNTNMPSILMQIMFISNPLEEKKLNDEAWQRLLATELAYALLSFVGFKTTKDNCLIKDEKNKTTIMGTSLSTSQQMEDFLHSRNPNAPYLAKLYLSIGLDEGIRGDIAFAQALIETDFFKSIKCCENHNYIGIKLTEPKLQNAIFDTPADGIRSHIQHLKAYASTERLNTPLTDPIFHLVTRGIAPCWEDLDIHWIMPKLNYGEKIISLWKEMINPLSKDQNNFNTILSKWKDKGILIEDIDLDKPLTWKEFIVIQDHLLRKE